MCDTLLRFPSFPGFPLVLLRGPLFPPLALRLLLVDALFGCGGMG